MNHPHAHSRRHRTLSGTYMLHPNALLAAGAILALSAPPLNAQAPAPINLDVNGLGVDNGGADVQPQQVALVARTVAFTLQTRSMLLSPNPLKWAWPVKETAATPWVVANGGNFSGGSEGYNHKHDTILPAPPAMGTHYGSHPHIQLYLFVQRSPLVSDPPAPQPLQLIGFSELKHTFATKASGPLPNQAAEEMDPHHYFNPGTNDVYGNGSNQDRNFLGPMSEMDFATFKVADHDHFGNRVMVPNPAPPPPTIPLTEDGFNVWERDHGEPQHAGDMLGHLLTANATQLLLTTEMIGAQPGVQLPNTQWFFAASYFVFDPNAAAGAGGREMDLTNNSVFRQFTPGWNGANFDPMWLGDSMRLMPGTLRTFVPVDQPGVFVEPVPEPGTLALLSAATLVLGTCRSRRRRPA